MKRKFVAPEWGNVYPEPIPPPSTGKAKLDAAFAALFDGTADLKTSAVAARAGEDVLLALFDGALLTAGQPYWNEAKVGALKSTSDKRSQRSAYDDATSEKAGRQRIHLWFANLLVKTARGRERLLEVVAGDHAWSLRSLVTRALREAKLDAPFRKRLAKALDPRNWAASESPAVVEQYSFGVVCALETDPARALRELAPILAPKTARKAGLPRARATAVLIGITHTCERAVLPVGFPASRRATWSSAASTRSRSSSTRSDSRRPTSRRCDRRWATDQSSFKAQRRRRRRATTRRYGRSRHSRGRPWPTRSRGHRD